jgi:hypothetical protein
MQKKKNTKKYFEEQKCVDAYLRVGGTTTKVGGQPGSLLSGGGCGWAFARTLRGLAEAISNYKPTRRLYSKHGGYEGT